MQTYGGAGDTYGTGTYGDASVVIDYSGPATITVRDRASVTFADAGTLTLAGRGSASFTEQATVSGRTLSTS